MVCEVDNIMKIVQSCFRALHIVGDMRVLTPLSRDLISARIGETIWRNSLFVGASVWKAKLR